MPQCQVRFLSHSNCSSLYSMMLFMKKTLGFRLKHVVNVVRAKANDLRLASKRSPKWHSLEEKVLAAQPTCVACGGTTQRQVHHIIPFHLKPELELEPTNLIVLCMAEWDCHLRIGHGSSFKTFNPRVVEDAKSALTLLTHDDGTGMKTLWASCKSQRKAQP